MLTHGVSVMLKLWDISCFSVYASSRWD